MELVSDIGALEPLSPELVLVSPPEVAARARAFLAPVELWRPLPIDARVDPSRERLPFAVFCVLCLAMTLAPLALIVGLR
jgi:hypothetical protein